MKPERIVREFLQDIKGKKYLQLFSNLYKKVITIGTMYYFLYFTFCLKKLLVLQTNYLGSTNNIAPFLPSIKLLINY